MLHGTDLRNNGHKPSTTSQGSHKKGKIQKKTPLGLAAEGHPITEGARR